MMAIDYIAAALVHSNDYFKSSMNGCILKAKKSSLFRGIHLIELI